MDDETCRPGVKDDLTCRDEYLASRFTRLSASGHDLTPMTAEEIQMWKTEHLPEYNAFIANTTNIISSSISSFKLEPDTNDDGYYMGINQKGVYVCNIGGLPVFSSGSRIPHLCNHTHLVFNEPCDGDHIKLIGTREDKILVAADNDALLTAIAYDVICARTNITIGKAVNLPLLSSSSSSSSNAHQYIIDSNGLIFLPLRSKWPIPSQPENYWGTEGMFTVWMMNE